jgi:hypothetical protein
MEPVRTFVIRRALVVPLGLMIPLTIALMVVCVVQGQPIAKIIILALLILPMSALFIEAAFRRVVVDQDGVTAFRPFRQRHVAFDDVTELESVRVRSRVFITLVAGPDDFLIISNSYREFPALVKDLIAAVPEGTVTEETQQLAKLPPFRQADAFTVWFAVVALVYVLIAQFKV